LVVGWLVNCCVGVCVDEVYCLWGFEFFHFGFLGG
jgi:hypothetical protein